MGIRLRSIPRFQVLDGNGNPLSGGKVYTYQPGTSTAKATYTDHTGDTENANPVILDARGEATIYWDGTYKVIVKDSSDVTIWTEDNYGEGEDSVLTGNFNLVKNGSFEIDANGDGDPDDWDVTEYTGSGGVSRDSTEQIHGQYALKFVSTGSGGGFATSDYFEVQESRIVPIGFAIKSSVADVHNKVDIIWYTAAKAVVSTTNVYDDAATNPTSWTYKTYTETPPANARFAKLRFYGCVDDDATTGTTWFDNVSAEAYVISSENLDTYFPNVNGAVAATDEELSKINGLTGTDKAVVVGTSGTLEASTVTKTELAYMSGATAGTVLTTGDEGPGNGIDADTLDGSHASAFLLDGTGTVDQTNLASSAVGQGELKTDTGSVSVSCLPVSCTTEDDALLPGGTYGFYPDIRATDNGQLNTTDHQWALNRAQGGVSISTDGDTGYSTRIWIYALDNGGDKNPATYARQRYIQASPPYDLGDGEIPLFIFARVTQDGYIGSIYEAPEAPWIYNGPTDVRAQRIDKASGRKYRRRRDMSSVPFTLAEAKKDPGKLREYIAAFKEAQIIEEEITQAMKHADMAIFPSPFRSKHGTSVVLLDPVSDVTRELAELREHDEFDVSDILRNHMKVDNTPLSRKGPPGIDVVGFTWK